MSEEKPVQETPATEEAPSSSAGFATQLAVVLSALALGVALWQWLDVRHRNQRLEQTLTQRLSQFDDRNRESHVVAQHAEDVAGQTSARVALLEQRLEESRAQQEALQTLYLELANNRDAWTISEVEQLLIIANQQLQLAGNVKPALLALQTADARLREIDKPQILALRKVIDRDILRLQALPSVDVVNMGLRIDMLVETIDRLPLASDRHPRPENTARPEQETGTWPRLAREIWQDVRNMVRIQRMDQPELPLLEPDQAYFLRENLKLCLLTARVALLQRDEATYRSDLKRATEWLKRYFNTDDPVGKNALLSLQQLGSSAISIDIPDVSQSLGAVNNYKLALERKKP